MKKLIEEYQKIINEDSLKQQINEFYKNAIPIKGSIPDKTFFNKKINFNDLFIESILDDDNIITEIGEAKESLFNKIYNGPDVQHYSHSEIINYLNKSWNKYESFKQSNDKLDLIIIKVNFSNISKLVLYTRKYKVFGNRNLTINDYKQKCNSSFSNVNGLIFEANNTSYIFLNDNGKLNISTIKHEFTHYLQRILRGVVYDIDEYEQGYREIDAYFSINIPILLNKLYYSFYKDKMSKQEFLSKYIKSSFTQNETDFDKDLKEKLKYISNKKNDLTLLALLKYHIKSQSEKFKAASVLSNNFLEEK